MQHRQHNVHLCLGVYILEGGMSRHLVQRGCAEIETNGGPHPTRFSCPNCVLTPLTARQGAFIRMNLHGGGGGWVGFQGGALDPPPL